MIVFAHSKFGLVQIQESGVKRGGGGGGGAESVPPSERVFQIPVQVGLKATCLSHCLKFRIFAISVTECLISHVAEDPRPHFHFQMYHGTTDKTNFLEPDSNTSLSVWSN